MGEIVNTVVTIYGPAIPLTGVTCNLYLFKVFYQNARARLLRVSDGGLHTEGAN